MSERLKKVWFETGLVFNASLRGFFLNRNLEKAATLAYYGALALMPLLLAAIFLLGFVMHSSEAVLTAMEKLMAELFPAFSGAILHDLMAISRQKTWGVVALVVLLWSVTPFASAFRAAIQRILRMDNRLNFALGKLLDLSAVLVVLLLFVFLAARRALMLARLPEWLAPPPFLTLLVVHAITIGVLCFFYWVFSSFRTRWAHLVFGAAAADILLSIIRPLFGLFLRYNPNYGYAFGSLKAVFLLIIWVYYTLAVVLYGAEVIAAIRRRHALLLCQLFSPGLLRKAAQILLEQFTTLHDQGEVLFNDGDSGKTMYYVLSGKIAIAKGGHLLKEAGPGEYLGEMSMLLDTPRTATAAIAAPETRLVAISEDNFETILRENPEIMRKVLKEMAQRLKATSEQVRGAPSFKPA